MKFWLLLGLVATACVDSELVPCGALSCPRGALCVAGRCVHADSLTACTGLAEGAACSSQKEPGTCVDGACVVPHCGNGAIEAGEACDGTVGDATCADAGFYAGTLACTALCQLDTSACTRRCGDGERTDAELCDGADLGGKSCSDAGFYAGTLACNGSCLFDVSGCTESCGDGLVNGPEQCDGAPAVDCVNLGYDVGRIACSDRCTLSLAACRQIGWHRENAGIGSATLESIAITPSGIEYVAGFGIMLRHAPGGAWETIPLPAPGAPPTLHDIAASADDNIYAVGSLPGLGGVAYHYDGTAWSYDNFGGKVAWLVAIAGNRAYLGQNDWMKVNIGGTWQAAPNIGDGAWSLWGLSTGEVLIGTLAGDILRGIDGIYSTVFTVPAVPHGFWGRSDDDIYFVFGASLAHWDGTSWQLVPIGGEPISPGFVYGNATELYVLGGGATGPIANRLAGGTWTTELAPIPGAIWSVRYNAVTQSTIAVTYEGGVFRSDGTGWSRHLVSSAAAPKDLAVIGNDVWIALDDGSVGHESATGWTTTPVSTGPLSSIYARAANDIFVAGNGPVLYHYGGASWQPETPPASDARVGRIWGTGSEVFAVTARATTTNLWHRAVNGTWSTMTSPVAARLYGLWGASATDVWAAGDGVLLHYDGQAWTSVASPTSALLKAIDGRSVSDIDAVGQAGTILHYDGTQWTRVATGRGGTLRAVSGGLAVGRGVALQLFDGTGWSTLRPPDDDLDQLGAVHQLDAHHYLVAGHRRTAGLVLYTLTL